MTDVQPSVSTDGNERTMAFFLAIRRVPNARQVVMTAGKPSGIAATAKGESESQIVFFWGSLRNEPRATAILK